MILVQIAAEVRINRLRSVLFDKFFDRFGNIEEVDAVQAIVRILQQFNARRAQYPIGGRGRLRKLR